MQWWRPPTKRINIRTRQQDSGTATKRRKWPTRYRPMKRDPTQFGRNTDTVRNEGPNSTLTMRLSKKDRLSPNYETVEGRQTQRLTTSPSEETELVPMLYETVSGERTQCLTTSPSEETELVPMLYETVSGERTQCLTTSPSEETELVPILFRDRCNGSGPRNLVFI